MKYFFLSVFMLILSSSDPLQAQVPWRAGGESSGSELKLSLVTIDPGDELTMWWGHTAVVVTDTLRQVSRFYNYGLFSFEQDNFVWNFIQGRLIFWVGDWDAARALQYYRSLNRTIRIQYLNLSPQKRLETALFLANNVRPENREYLYDHYRDNCATRVRDLFDKILDGQFFEATQDPGRLTFRGHTRRHTSHNSLMDWLLMFLMSDTIDEPIRHWDEMFLPTELEKNLDKFSYVTEEGDVIPLVNHTELFFEAENREAVPDYAPSHTLWFFTGAIVFSFLVLLLLIIKTGNRIYTGSIYILFGLVFGVLGIVLFFLSQFTDHTVTFGNENLFYANPVTFLLFIFGIALLFNWRIFVKRVRVFIYTLTIIAWAGLLLKVMFSFPQDNWLAIATILPILSSFSLYSLLSRRRVRGEEKGHSV